MFEKLGRLFYDKGSSELSLGRIFSAILFGVAVVIWVGGAEIPASMLTILITLIGYILTGKIIDVAKVFKK
jgi:hypothetical protein